MSILHLHTSPGAAARAAPIDPEKLAEGIASARGLPRPLAVAAFVVAVTLAVAPLELSAQILGMVADDTTDSVTVFDADTHAVLGTVSIDPGPSIGNVLITPDLKRGFVTNFDFKVFVIDLTTSPPSLAGGTNPIPISNFGNDLSISPDGKFLVVTGGSQSISVIDIAARAEISSVSTDTDNKLAVCSNGSVLATSFGTDTVRRFTLSDTGTLTDTGEVLMIDRPEKIYCAPGAASAFVMPLVGGITSFTIPGLSAVDTRPLSGFVGMSGVISPSGNRVLVRSLNPGAVDVFGFTQATGALGASPLLTFSVADAPFFLSTEQIALHPNGGKLFASEPDALRVYNPATGALLASITDPAIVDPAGVAVVTQPPTAEPFSSLRVTLELELRLPGTHRDKFEIEARFRVGAASDGIDLSKDNVVLTIGSLSANIPAGSFQEHGRGVFKFNGTIGGMRLSATVRPLGGGRFALRAKGRGADLTGIGNPVAITLTIGNDSGSASVVADTD